MSEEVKGSISESASEPQSRQIVCVCVAPNVERRGAIVVESLVYRVRSVVFVVTTALSPGSVNPLYD